jgi:hypothetical protein
MPYHIRTRNKEQQCIQLLSGGDLRQSGEYLYHNLVLLCTQRHNLATQVRLCLCVQIPLALLLAQQFGNTPKLLDALNACWFKRDN